MILVLESLRDEMRMRPRYWERLLQVLATTLDNEDTPLLVRQVGVAYGCGDGFSVPLILCRNVQFHC